MEKKKKEDKTYLLVLALLMLSGFFVLLFLLPEKEKHDGNGSAQSQEFQAKVNHHLFKTSQDIQMSHDRMQMEADKLADRGVGQKAAPKEDINHLDFSTDPRAEALLRELGRDVKESGGPENADEAVQTELFESQQYQEYSDAYKKEYARQFVENARKSGYIIKLNDDYKVISIRLEILKNFLSKKTNIVV